MAFKKATKKKSKLRLALIGPSGSGKSYSALSIASGLGKKIAVIDTEGSSASLYAGKFDFDEDTLKTFNPKEFIKRINDAVDGGYDVLIIDSLSHAWFGTEGALEMVQKEQVRSKSNNSFTAWRNVTPIHNQLVNAIIQAPIHVIATMRAKEKYVMDEENGKTRPRKIGLEAIQRDGMNFEFTIVADMDMDHNMIISKTRMETLDNAIINKPGKDFAKQLLDWLDSGDEVSTEAVPKPKPEVKEKVIQQESVAPEVESELGANEPSSRVLSKLDQVFTYLKSVTVEDENDTLLAAKLLITQEFGVDKPEDIPDERFDEFYKYLQVPMLKALKADGFIK